MGWNHQLEWVLNKTMNFRWPSWVWNTWPFQDVLLTQLLVFLSPLYTMVSAFLYEPWHQKWWWQSIQWWAVIGREKTSHLTVDVFESWEEYQQVPNDNNYWLHYCICVNIGLIQLPPGVKLYPVQEFTVSLYVFLFRSVKRPPQNIRSWGPMNIGAGKVKSSRLFGVEVTNSHSLGAAIYQWDCLVGGFTYFSPRTLGKWSNLTYIFQMGWNHHLVVLWI